MLSRKTLQLSCSKLRQHGLAITVESIVIYTNITLKYAAYSFHSARLSFCFLLALGCGEPPEVYDSWNMTVLSGTSNGNEITFSCVEGFEIYGDPKVVCQPNQEWSKAPTCKSEFIDTKT